MSFSREEVVLNEMKDYSKKWEISSKHNERKGYYDWMLSQLTPNSKILEIGCGSGISTLKLFNNSKLIVSVDENPFCVDTTFSYLLNNNVNILLEKRIGDIAILDGKNTKGTKWTYKRNFRKINSDTYSNTLIEGDIQNDEELILWLLKNYEFDYIVCWLMGTYDFKTLDDNYEGVFLDDTKDEYRWKVLNKLTKLQQRFPRKKPLIHVVDRIEFPHYKYERIEIIEDYSKKLKIAVNRMKVAFKKYEVGNGVQLVSIDNRVKIDDIDIGLISVLIKP